MGFFFEFDAVNSIMCCRWEGPVTDELLLEGYSAAGKLLASRPPCRAINDFSGVTGFDVSNETISRLAKMPSAVPVESMHVIVAPKDLPYGLARMFSILGEPTRPNLYVVRTVEVAHAFLEITSPQFSRIKVA